MKVNLKYGRGGLEVDMGGNEFRIFRTKDMPVIEDPNAVVQECLEKPVGSRPLRDIARDRQSVCIVVSDITRPAPNKVLLPPIIDTLEQTGISSRRIRILVATGIHRTPTRDELVEMLGEKILAKYAVLSHNARSQSDIKRLGYTSSGTPIDVNRLYMESDLKIVASLVEPHFMAGYSGGRKSIAIGLTSVEAVKHLHGTKFLEDTGSRNCELVNNPLHAELTEIATAAGCDFCVNAVIDTERRPAGVFAGDLVLAHNRACEFAERFAIITVDDSFPVVVTTSAGYPLDTTFYQAVKGLVGALGILSPGGSIVLAAECSNGLGSKEFRQMLERLVRLRSLDAFLQYISEPANFTIDQWEVEMLMKALRRGTVYLYSTGIAESDWPLTHAARVDSVEEGVSLALASAARDARIAVIPEGPYVIPVSKNV